MAWREWVSAASFADLDLVSPAGVRVALARAGLRLRPSRGQHFLTNPRILDRILAAASPGPADVVLEPGAGIGTLTVALARTRARVVAVEVDGRFIPVLREVCAPYPRVHIVCGDAMALAGHDLPAMPTMIVANLPYSVASPLLVRLLEQTSARRYVIMVQEEVGERIIARANTPQYGLLSVAVQARAMPVPVTRVPRTSFYPPPRVSSMVVRLDVPDTPPVARDLAPVVMTVARAAFGQRRKMLRSALQTAGRRRLSRQEVEEWCRQAGIDPTRRGESLSVGEFARLAGALAGSDEVLAPLGDLPGGTLERQVSR